MAREGKIPALEIVSRGMYICNTVYISPVWKDIRNADMNELSEMPAVALERFKNIEWNENNRWQR